MIAASAELVAQRTVLAAEAAKAAASDEMAGAEEAKRSVATLDMSHFNSQAWKLRGAADEQLVAANHLDAVGSRLLKGHKYAEAKSAFDESAAASTTATLAYNEVDNHPKHNGHIYRIDYHYTIGKEDKESNTGMLVRYPGGDVHIDMGKHRSRDYSSPWMTAEGLNISIQEPVPIDVGIKDGPHDRNCDVDGQFDLKLYFIDDEGRRWDASYSVPMTFYSTAGQGYGSSKTRTAVTVTRYQFAD